MFRPRLILGVVGLVLTMPLDALAASDVSIGELIETGAEFSGVEVVVEGELIGDYGFRDDGSMWTQLNGDVYATSPILEGESAEGGNLGIGVRVPAAMARDLDPPGGYRVRGPIVRLTGIWKYHDPARQGESFLDVQGLEVVEPGRALTEDVNWWTILSGALLLVAAAVAWMLRPRE